MITAQRDRLNTPPNLIINVDKNHTSLLDCLHWGNDDDDLPVDTDFDCLLDVSDVVDRTTRHVVLTMMYGELDDEWDARRR